MKRAIQESKTTIPRGMATHLPEGASFRRYAQDVILSTFFKWGYREVVTPVFEYLDILSAGLSSDLLEKSYKFVDRESGKLILLRPDITPQVARMAAGILADEPKPLRLCYYGNIFRYEESHAGREREISQVGCELIGISSPEADAEVITVASDAIRNFGIGDFKIVIGQVGYLNGVMSFIREVSGQNLSPEHEHSLLEAIIKKDVDRIDSILDIIGIAITTKSKILLLPSLFGGHDILSEASDIVKNKESLSAIENLEQIYTLLCSHGLRDYILFDLCDIRGIDYYTGLFFEIFAPGMAYPIGRGGRYDNLIGRFGHDCASTGFAIDIESIISTRKKMGEAVSSQGFDYLIIGNKKDNRSVAVLSRQLRDAGYSVIMDTSGNDLESALKYASYYNIEKVIITDDIKKESLSVIDVISGKRSRIKQDRLTQTNQHRVNKR